MIGIYKLIFKGLEDWPYVGKSLDIKGRFRSHKTSLDRGDSNYKLQEAFDSCGLPILVVLEECSSEELNFREQYWIELLDSINNGLNITKGGDSSGSGYNHARSKFSREQLINSLDLLTNPSLTFEQIADITGVSKNQIYGISKGRTHQWLLQEFPEKFEILSKINRFLHGFEDDLKITLISPKGEEFITINGSELAKSSNELTGIQEVISGKSRQYRGWTLKGNELSTFYFLSPLEEVYVIKERGLAPLAKRFGLHKTSLALMVRGQQKQHHGWRCISKEEANNFPLGE